RLTQDVEETRQVPRLGDVVFAGNVDQAAQRWIAVQLGQAVVERAVPQGNGQQDDAPGAFDRAVIAAVAAGGAEAIEQRLVGDGCEEVTDGGQGGTVFQLAPGEERLS